MEMENVLPEERTKGYANISFSTKTTPLSRSGIDSSTGSDKRIPWLSLFNVFAGSLNIFVGMKQLRIASNNGEQRTWYQQWNLTSGIGSVFLGLFFLLIFGPFNVRNDHTLVGIIAISLFIPIFVFFILSLIYNPGLQRKLQR